MHLELEKSEIPDHLLEFFEPVSGIKNLDLLGIPWRVALALQSMGWYLRADCIWTKLSAMPSSVQGWRWERCRVKTGNGKRSAEKKAVTTAGRPHGGRAANGKDFDSLAEWSDCPGCSKCLPNGGFVLRRGSWRPTTAHEYIFLFAKSEKYYADGYAVRQRLAEATIMRDRYTRVLDDPDEQYAVAHDHETVSDPDIGANLRSWLVFKSEQFKGKHYAVFPPELPSLAIKCGTSEKGVCPHCGAPWARIVKTKQMTVEPGPRTEAYQESSNGGSLSRTCVSGTMTEPPSAETLGWRQTCKCPEHEPIPAVILDPFSGAGTSVLAARRLHRRAIGIELYEKNVSMSRKRIAADLPLFNAVSTEDAAP